MNENEIRNMEAGRGLDALVAERVMRIAIMSDERKRTAAWGHGKSSPGNVKAVNGVFIYYNDRGGIKKVEQAFHRYSTNIAAAWEVVEKMRERGLDVSIANREHNTWGVDFWRTVKRGEDRCWFGDAGALPLAICRAALLAVMGDES